MNPQQQPPQPPYQPQPDKPGSEYDFFMSPDRPPKVNRLQKMSSGNNSTAMRAVLIAVLAFAVIIVAYLILSVVTSGNSNKPKLVIVAQDQNELIRVANLATSIGQDQSAQTTQNFAESAALSLSTEQQQLLSFMTSHGGQPTATQLAATKDTSSDTALNNAVQASNFDPTFIGIMQNQLKNYRVDLQSAFQTAHNNTEKQLLSNDFNGATLLLKQLNSPTQ